MESSGNYVEQVWAALVASNMSLLLLPLVFHITEIALALAAFRLKNIFEQKLSAWEDLNSF